MIVNAAEESESVVAFDKKTGKQVWKAEAAGLSGTWGTPVLVEVPGDRLPGGRTDLVIAVPEEIWGLNPTTGKLIWHAEASNSNTVARLGDGRWRGVRHWRPRR